MRSRCEELRERAFQHGLESGSGRAWRVHCRSCSACRTELYVLEALQRQAVEERHHLGQREVAELLRAVRTQAPPRSSPGRAALAWGVRFACFAMVFLIAAQFTRDRWRGAARPNRDNAAPVRVLGNVGRDGLATLASSPGPHAVKAVQAVQPLPAAFEANSFLWPPDPGRRDVQRRLSDLRRDIESRRQALLNLTERDFGEQERHDAGFCPNSSVPTLV